MRRSSSSQSGGSLILLIQDYYSFLAVKGWSNFCLNYIFGLAELDFYVSVLSQILNWNCLSASYGDSWSADVLAIFDCADFEFFIAMWASDRSWLFHNVTHVWNRLQALTLWFKASPQTLSCNAVLLNSEGTSFGGYCSLFSICFLYRWTEVSRIPQGIKKLVLFLVIFHTILKGWNLRWLC